MACHPCPSSQSGQPSSVTTGPDPRHSVFPCPTVPIYRRTGRGPGGDGPTAMSPPSAAFPAHHCTRPLLRSRWEGPLIHSHLIGLSKTETPLPHEVPCLGSCQHAPTTQAKACMCSCLGHGNRELRLRSPDAMLPGNAASVLHLFTPQGSHSAACLAFPPCPADAGP